MKKNQPPTWLGWQLMGDSPGYMGTCQAVLVMVITQKANCLRERSPYPKHQRRIMAQHCTDACTFSEWQFIQQDGLVPCPRPLAEARPGLSETQRASPPRKGQPGQCIQRVPSRRRAVFACRYPHASTRCKEATNQFTLYQYRRPPIAHGCALASALFP